MTAGTLDRSAGDGLAADALVAPWFTALRERLGDIQIFDTHTHLGCADPDGSCFDAGELQGALGVVDARAVVFSLAEPGSYPAANDRVLAAAKDSGDRLVAFCRLDPNDGGVPCPAAGCSTNWRSPPSSQRRSHPSPGTWRSPVDGDAARRLTPQRFARRSVGPRRRPSRGLVVWRREIGV